MDIQPQHLGQRLENVEKTLMEKASLDPIVVTHFEEKANEIMWGRQQIFGDQVQKSLRISSCKETWC